MADEVTPKDGTNAPLLVVKRGKGRPASTNPTSKRINPYTSASIGKPENKAVLALTDAIIAKMGTRVNVLDVMNFIVNTALKQENVLIEKFISEYDPDMLKYRRLEQKLKDRGKI